jgi:hypothetical protein
MAEFLRLHTRRDRGDRCVLEAVLAYVAKIFSVDARQCNVPGRKTDVDDATWIADLLAHRLIRSSFIPPTAIQEFRGLTRTRKQLVLEVTQPSLRIQKILEDASLKLGSVLSNVPQPQGVMHRGTIAEIAS